MNERPGEWHLLGTDGDPLPGDSYEVAAEAHHYQQTAEGIREQVARLRQMASDTNELVGKFAPELRDSAEKLADHLEQAQGRFDTVAEQLRRWHPVLEYGQVETGSLLRRAEETQHEIALYQPPTTPVDTKDDVAVAAELTRSHRLNEATSELNSLVSRFQNLMSEVNRTADEVARRIDDASHDRLKDSWWDSHVRKFIHDHANFLKFVADVFTWIATAIVVAIVLLSNPAGWLVLAAMLLTAGALIIHSALAANSDGSWADVALDAFALVTMGSGKLLSEGARTALAIREGIGAWSETSVAARQAFADASGFLSKTGVWLSRSNVVSRNMRGLDAALSKVSETLNGEIHGSVPWLTRLAFGEKEGALLHQAIRNALAKFGPGLLLNSAHAMSNAARTSFITGSLIDVGGKILNPAFPRFWSDGSPIKPGVPAWERWTEEHTVHGAPVFR